jgi:2-oxoglutarate ferredoxin oxidoreductase subunit gamma
MMGVRQLVSLGKEGTIQILLAGSGGQGLGVAGQILAEAACLYSGLEAAQKQSYGARARGGSSQSTVTISRQEILFPILERPQVLIALTQSGYDQGCKRLADGGLIIFENESVVPGRATLMAEAREEGFPFFAEAIKLANERGITIMALGAMVELTGVVTAGAMEQAMTNNFSPNLHQLNWPCFLKGMELARERKNGGEAARATKTRAGKGEVD